MTTFPELVASRRQWIDEVLKPWCKRAPRQELLLAEQAWTDLAGRPAPEMTLWLWAWSRFPSLCADGLHTLNEAHPVTVTCHDGRSVRGYPDARQTQRGKLVLLDERGAPWGPVSIDEIAGVTSSGG